MKKTTFQIVSIVSFILSVPLIGSAQWIQCTSGQTGPFVQSGLNLFSTSTGLGIYLSTDFGETWVKRLDRDIVYSLVAVGSRYLLASSVDSGILRSSDSGVTWSIVKRLPKSPYPAHISVIGTTVFARYDSVTLKSIDSGTSWTVLYQNLPAIPVIAIDSFLFSASSDTILRSSDGGANWIVVDTGVRMYSFTVIDKTLFALRSGDSVFLKKEGMLKTTDYGMTWSEQDSLDSWLFGFLYAYHNYLFGGYNASVGDLEISTDSGASWKGTHFYGSLFHRASSVIVSGPNIVVGTANTGIWYCPLSAILSSLSVVNQTVHPDNILLSPNPTAGVVTILADNTKHVTVENLLGRSVLELATPRAPDFTLDLTKLPAGLYFARFEMASGEVMMRKIVKSEP